jgi:hypothetical protein
MAASTDDARNWLHKHLKTDTAALADVLADKQADGYASAALALAAEGAKTPLPAAELYDLDEYWSNWKPGDVGASDLLQDGGFQSLLEAQDVTIQGIAETTLDRMGTLLAQGAARGDSVDTIAGSLYDLLDDPQRAYSIADTELARAVSQSSADTFAANGIDEWDWLVSDGCCDECSSEEDANPHGLGDDQPPLHPMCRCAMSPRPGAYTPRDDEEIPEDSGDA